MGVKFYPQSSSFKRSLLDLPLNSEIVASQIAGDFVLPGTPALKGPAQPLTPVRMGTANGDAAPALRPIAVPGRPAATQGQVFARPVKGAAAAERAQSRMEPARATAGRAEPQPLELRHDPGQAGRAAVPSRAAGAATKQRKVVLIAGGIGITPFRSMVKYLLDTRQQRPLVLIYANSGEEDIVYTDVFKQAERELGMHLVYTLTDRARVSPVWTGRVGYVDTAMIREEVPDYGQCLFYVSGPNAMVDTTVRMLGHLGIHSDQIKTDFFPGLT